jgi:DNA polymerase-3 subunit beta
LTAKYLSDVLSVIQTDEVALELTTPAQPGVIKPVGEKEENYTHVIMPLTKR